MHVVIFEVEPHHKEKDSYLEIATQLRAELESIDGFISVERFQSLTNPNKLLSLSVWRDETAISVWRNKNSHQLAQKKGRDKLFAAYRIRVANVIRDYDLANSPWQNN
ncbi:MAG: antibiotic biosynthesis monooxygenase [Rhodospirillaceae bacterium]|nr:antibiotic biosynthesis monooxygenase [Rhodospirillaceae bacterium]